jgi:uncharacterized protein YgbK (DUF1537 family)
VDLVVLDTETRSLEAEAGRAGVRDALGILRADGRTLVYKKVDSTLRGNVGAEIQAVAAAGWHVLLAPALPSAGRVVRGGRVYVRGVPLGRTESARDPRDPVTESALAAIVGAQTHLVTRGVSLRHVRGRADALRRRLEHAVWRGVRVLLADAERAGDLAALAAALSGMETAILPCGSAGLWEAFICQGPPTGAVAPAPAMPRVNGPLLVVSASASAQTRAQIEYAAAGGAVVLRPATQGGARIGEAVARALAAGRSVIADCGSDPGRRDAAAPLSWAEEAFHAGVGHASGLVLVGGQTAYAICRAAGARAIDIRGAVEPLVPRGVLVGGSCDGLPVVTKAGGLGTVEAISRALTALGTGPG